MLVRSKQHVSNIPTSAEPQAMGGRFLRTLAYLVIYDSGQVSLEHLLAAPSQSQPTLTINPNYSRPVGRPLAPYLQQKRHVE